MRCNARFRILWPFRPGFLEFQELPALQSETSSASPKLGRGCVNILQDVNLITQTSGTRLE